MNKRRAKVVFLCPVAFRDGWLLSRVLSFLHNFSADYLETGPSQQPKRMVTTFLKRFPQTGLGGFDGYSLNRR